jgi:hypothetical protein
VRVIYADQFEQQSVRAHPYRSGLTPDVRYYDFKARPELIPRVLEDFMRWSHYPAIQRFYDLIRWINGPESVFESNDSRFTGVQDSHTPVLGSLEALCGVMIFLRDLALNLSPQHVEW